MRQSSKIGERGGLEVERQTMNRGGTGPRLCPVQDKLPLSYIVLVYAQEAVHPSRHD